MIWGAIIVENLQRILDAVIGSVVASDYFIICIVVGLLLDYSGAIRR